jgi:hypothetical protein
VVALLPEAERALLAAERGIGVVTGARAVANFAGRAGVVGSLGGGLPSTVGQERAEGQAGYERNVSELSTDRFAHCE